MDQVVDLILSENIGDIQQAVNDCLASQPQRQDFLSSSAGQYLGAPFIS